MKLQENPTMSLESEIPDRFQEVLAHWRDRFLTHHLCCVRKRSRGTTRVVFDGELSTRFSFKVKQQKERFHRILHRIHSINDADAAASLKTVPRPHHTRCRQCVKYASKVHRRPLKFLPTCKNSSKRASIVWNWKAAHLLTHQVFLQRLKRWNVWLVLWFTLRPLWPFESSQVPHIV